MSTSAMPDAERSVVGRLRSRRAFEILSTLIPFLALVVLVASMNVAAPGFASTGNLQVIADNASLVLVLAIGQTVVILTGAIDLSVGALVSLGSVIVATLLGPLGFLAIPVVLVALTAAGALQGLVQSRTRIPSFLVTLGGQGLWSGIALTWTHGKTVQATAHYGAVGWLTNSVAGVPADFVFGLGLTIAAAAAIRWLRIGRQVRAVGHAERVAILSGLSVSRVKTTAFAFSGMCAGLASMVIVAQQYSGSPVLGDNLLLPSIAAVVVGGTAITGGSGGVGLTVIGALILSVLNVGLSAVNVPATYVQVIFGLALIATMAVTTDRSKLSGILK